MSFWPVVITTLIAVPMVLYGTGMAMIFAAAGLAGGPQESRSKAIVHGWLAFAWILVGVFGAFGATPAWRAWHGGGENFAGALQAFVGWLLAAAAAGALGAVALRAFAAVREGRAEGHPLVAGLRWLLLAIGFVPWAALVAWIAWPLALWPVHGAFQWPDPATGWTHTAEVTGVLFAAMLVENALRRHRRR